MAMPARTSGETRVEPLSLAGPVTTARWGSQRMIRAPIPMSLSTKNMRDSKSFSCTSTVPSTCVATTVMMDVRSGGKPGQGASSILGIWPPRSGFTAMAWSEETCSALPVMRQEMPSLAKAMRIMRRSLGSTFSMTSSPRVTAARPMKEPISMKSGPMAKSAPCSFSAPSMVRMFDPMPVMWPPMALIRRQRSWTWGSLAALRRMVVPLARAAPMMAFSVAVTEASSRKMSEPVSLGAVKTYCPLMSTRAPSSSRARKCVSSRRRPMTSPPGGARIAWPVRASRGPAKRMAARMRLACSAGISDFKRPLLVTRQSLGDKRSTVAPRKFRISNMTWTSSMSGMLRRRTGSSVSRVAAMQGRAAFLLPEARTLPLMGKPPSISYLYMGFRPW